VVFFPENKSSISRILSACFLYSPLCIPYDFSSGAEYRVSLLVVLSLIASWLIVVWI